MAQFDLKKYLEEALEDEDIFDKTKSLQAHQNVSEDKAQLQDNDIKNRKRKKKARKKR